MDDVKIKITATDQTAGAFASAKKGLTDLGSQAVALAAGMGLVGVAIAATAAAASGFGNITRGLDKLNDIKDATGASVEKISALEDVAKRTGASIETVETALIKFNAALKNSAPNSEIEKALAGIGLKAAELKAMDPADALLVTARALSQFADDGDKARLVQELFGKSLKDVAPLLNDLSTKTELNGTVTAEAAAQAERWVHAVDSLHKSSEDFKRQIVGFMLPYLADILEYYNKINEAGARWLVIQDQMKGLWGGNRLSGDFAKDTNAMLAERAGLLKTIQGLEAGPQNGFVEKQLGNAYDDLAKIDKLMKVAEARKTIEDGHLKTYTTGQESALPSVGYKGKTSSDKAPDHFADNFINQLITEYANLSGSMSKTEEVTRKLDTATEKFTATQRGQILTLAGQIDAIKRADAAAKNMADYQATVVGAIEHSTDAHYASMEAIQALNKDQAFELTLLGKLPLQIDAARFARDLANKERVAEAALVDRAMQAGWDENRMNQERLRLQRDLAEAHGNFGKLQADQVEQMTDPMRGMRDALRDYQQDIAKFGTNTKNVLTNAFKGAEDALVNFVKTGKLDFSGMVDSMMSDLIRLQIQKNVMPWLSNTIGDGFGSLIGNIFGGGRASGGDVAAGMLYRVNERGPEILNTPAGQFLMMGDQGGSVTPNAGGSGQVVNIHINSTVGDIASKADIAQANNRLALQIKAALVRDKSYGGAFA